MNPSLAWSTFTNTLTGEVVGSEVWASALRQMTIRECVDGVVSFACPNNGVKTIAQNRQRDLLSITTRALGVEVRGIIIDVVDEKIKTKTKKGAQVGAPLLEFEPSLQDMARASGLNPKNTFENYAVSHCNNVAFAASQVVVSQPGSAYNPLFLWGGVGVGKTHLAQATAFRILQLNRQARVFFCGGDKFTNEIIEAIRGRTTDKFRQKYRRLDVLIVDDIQFIAGKQTVQQEFFNTFNDIVGRGGQVILISDRPPMQINDIEDRLRSRFAGGLIIDISPPDFELKTAITMIKAKERGIEVDIEVAKEIAGQAQDNRMLEGILLSSYARALVRPATNQQDVTLRLQDVHSSSSSTTESGAPPAEKAMQTVCLFFQLKPIHLKQLNRTEKVAHARHVLMYILREKNHMGLIEIARFLKRKDHTTVLHGVQKIQELLIHDTNTKKEIDTICQNLGLSTTT